MSEDEKKDFNINIMLDKLKSSKDAYKSNVSSLESKSSYVPERANSDCLWSAVSKVSEEISSNKGFDNFFSSKIDFIGKNLEGGKFANEDLQNANFSVANLVGVDFSGSDLRGVDFSGANLSGANLSGANLTGAVLSGTVLAEANFTGAIMNGVKLAEADIQDALLLDIEIDDLGIEELQELIEYLAKYYPHKLNLSKLNLTLLDLSKIDLSKISLRGVDFTGVDFTGVNITGLDLSECIITPEQIAQALGRVPDALELKRILAPKVQSGNQNGKDAWGKIGEDVLDFFYGGKSDSVMDIGKVMDLGKKVFRRSPVKPEVKDQEILDHIKGERQEEIKSHNDELRKVIETRKKEELQRREEMKKEFKREIVKDKVIEAEIPPKENKPLDRTAMDRMRSAKERSRD